ncbi:unnamed protein product [Polarella glacialis]|uniref:Uncharacterized protein n=1 Tax=Polarella glacialis TaxID=89957 RepID=A0A813M125_POLGL|nr:unnamed protein product [Polarella glacialis]
MAPSKKSLPKGYRHRKDNRWAKKKKKPVLVPEEPSAPPVLPSLRGKKKLTQEQRDERQLVLIPEGVQEETTRPEQDWYNYEDGLPAPMDKIILMARILKGEYPVESQRTPSAGLPRPL